MPFVADSTVNKLILLFVFEKMEIPLTENSLLDITTSRNTWLSYMDFKDTMWQLIENNFVYRFSKHSAECLYTITQDGRMCLSHFYTKIPASIREEIINFTRDNKYEVRRVQEYTNDYFKNADGSHTVIFRIREPQTNEHVLEIRTKTATRHAAIQACQKWKDKAAHVYETIFNMLIQDDTEDK
ncbi:MAG: DUF4364 family protein [Firmicutes bacterium]|nr:DUF4364 family protein [Bacillota bacterium]